MPTETAVLFPGGHLTWAQLDKLIWRGAGFFSERGLKQGNLVGVSFRNPLLHLVTFLSLARIGISHVALPFSDSPDSRKQTAEYLELESIVTDSPEQERLEFQVIELKEFPKPKSDIVKIESSSSAGGSLPWLLIKSSGTTGEPKFAELNHDVSLQRYERWSDGYQYTTGDVFWIGIDIGSIAGKQQTLSSLQAGVAVCIPFGFKTYRAIIDFVKSSGVTLAFDIPSHLWKLVELSKGEPYLTSVRRFFTGATEVSEELRSEFVKKVNPNLYIFYGTNEAPCVTLSSPDLSSRVKNTVGIPHSKVELQVVGSDGQLVPQGVTGQIRLRGPGIVSGYFHNPSATSESFKVGWFYPGDLAYQSAEGAIILQGRTDEMIIYDGVNIYPSEIERVLSTHPQIKEVAAFSIKQRQFQEIPVAAVILNSESENSDIVSWSASRLGMKSPKAIFIVKEFPRNQMGKILRRELSKQFSITSSLA